MKYGMTDSEILTLLKFVVEPLKRQGARVWLFGSRATGRSRPFSDVDLLYEFEPQKVLPVGFIAQIKDAIEESNLPFKADLVQRSDLAESYRLSAESEKIEI